MSDANTGNNPATPTDKKKRGFAAMDPKLVREISSKGGKAAQAAGTAHKFDSKEAKAAGRKGGLKTGKIRRQKKDPDFPPLAGQAGGTETS